MPFWRDRDLWWRGFQWILWTGFHEASTISPFGFSQDPFLLFLPLSIIRNSYQPVAKAVPRYTKNSSVVLSRALMVSMDSNTNERNARWKIGEWICLVNIYRSRFHISDSPWQANQQGDDEYWMVGLRRFSGGGINGFAESSRKLLIN